MFRPDLHSFVKQNTPLAIAFARGRQAREGPGALHALSHCVQGAAFLCQKTAGNAAETLIITPKYCMIITISWIRARSGPTGAAARFVSVSGDEGLSSFLSAFAQKYRKQILILFDIVVVSCSYLLPWVLISGRTSFSEYNSLLISSCFFFVCCYEIVYGLMGMYDSLWRYAEIVEFFRLCVASIVAVAIFIVFTLVMFQERRVPISVYFLSAMFAGDWRGRRGKHAAARGV